jgi:hypothetical protein
LGLLGRVESKTRLGDRGVVRTKLDDVKRPDAGIVLLTYLTAP